MPWEIPVEATSELAAAFLQAAVTLALAALCAYLHRRYRKPYFLYWALAFLLYSLRLGAIISFLFTEARIWLFWHQVVTGLTALALLWAALVFARRVRWRSGYLLVLLFPVAWSYAAIYRLDNFMLAAAPAVAFLSGSTALTGWAFFRHYRQVRSTAARFLGVVFALWALHHLDYPFLRAQGVWNPWGYYLDVGFLLAVGLGILLLVEDDLRQGLDTLSSLSAVLQSGNRDPDLVEGLLSRLLTLPAVRGSAIYFVHEQADDAAGGPVPFLGAGTCGDWAGRQLPGAARIAVERAVQAGKPEIIREHPVTSTDAGLRHPYVAALPLLEGDSVAGAIVVVGEASDPFAALDDRFLLALCHQLGAALANADLYRQLESRTETLERLARLMVHQHEAERRRLSRELHDETAQVFAAVSMQLGLAREVAPPTVVQRLDRALDLVGDGIDSIRRVTEHLRPPLLDDLGLVPAMRALIDEFCEGHELDVTFTAPDDLHPISEDAELALFRALQEALSNTARHAHATRVQVTIDKLDAAVRMQVTDDGEGVGANAVAAATARGRTGLEGMRERLSALGGEVSVRNGSNGGTAVTVTVPAAPARRS